MTHARSLLAWGAAVASATVLATTAIAADEGAAAAAKSAATPAAGPQIAPPSSAVQALNRGIEAYRKNNHAAAIGAFSSAVSLGGLDSAGTAKALYFRGLAYRKQGRSAQAISDLTNALWLKNGLVEAERADAIANRAAAYKDAGIADPGTPVVVAAPAAPVAPESAASPAPAAGEPAKPEPRQRAAAVAPQLVPPKSASVAFANPATATISASESTPPQRIARAPMGQSEAGVVAERAPAAQPAVPAPAPATSSGSSLGSFFSNLFGGSSAQQSNAASAATSDVTTASTGIAAGPSTSATSSWNSATEVAARQAAPRVPASPAVSAPAAPAPAAPPRTAALGPARQASDAMPAASAGDAYSPSAAAGNAVSPGAVAPVAGNGRFRLQLAAVRSRAEAEAVAQRFSSEQSARAGGRTPAIEEAVFGNMGKFYRVNVGPFASAGEPEKLCQTLRASGYDCLIVGK